MPGFRLLRSRRRFAVQVLLIPYSIVTYYENRFIGILLHAVEFPAPIRYTVFVRQL